VKVINIEVNIYRGGHRQNKFIIIIKIAILFLGGGASTKCFTAFESFTITNLPLLYSYYIILIYLGLGHKNSISKLTAIDNSIFGSEKIV